MTCDYTIFSFFSAAKDATPLMIDRLSRPELLRIASVKFASRGWFIVLTEDETIRAQIPFDGNEILEEVALPGNAMALRVVNYDSIISSMEDGSGSSSHDNSGPLMPQSDSDAAESSRECYIGFSHGTGRAKCYDNTNNINVRLQLIPHE